MKNTKNTSLTVFPLPLLSRAPPMVLLLLLLLLFGPGGSPCHALDWECRANITVTAQDTAGVNITTERDGGAEHIMTTLFVQPRPGFQGVSLVGKVSDGDADEVVVAWFSLYNTCLQGYDIWWQLNAVVYKSIYRDGVALDELVFGVQVGHCYSVCRRGPFHNVLSLQVRAHGASRWSLTDCTNKIPVNNNIPSSLVPCSNPPPTPGVPPHTTSPTTPAAETPTPGVPPHTPSPTTPATEAPTPPKSPHGPSPTTPATETPPPYVLHWVGVGVAMLVVVILVVVVVVVRRRGQQMKPEDADQQRTSPAAPGVTEEVVNSLYEPFDRPAPSCVTEEVVNNLYEPFDRPAPSCVREEVVNNLYEPFDRPAPSCVREEVVNSLYEPFDRPAPSCVREEVVNTLYEPFDRPAPSCVREEVVNSLYEPFDRPAPSCVREEVVNSLYEPFDSLRQPPPTVTVPTHLQK